MILKCGFIAFLYAYARLNDAAAVVRFKLPDSIYMTLNMKYCLPHFSRCSPLRAPEKILLQPSVLTPTHSYLTFQSFAQCCVISH